MIGTNKKVMAIGAHPDDIELMCGGTLHKGAIDLGWELEFITICYMGKERESERLTSAKIFDAKSTCFGYDYMSLHYKQLELVSDLDRILLESGPDIVFVHDGSDHHLDHRVTSECVHAALRHSPISLVTYPSWNKRIPFDYNMRVEISKSWKSNMLKTFKTQSNAGYFNADSDHELFKIKHISF